MAGHGFLSLRGTASLRAPAVQETALINRHLDQEVTIVSLTTVPLTDRRSFGHGNVQRRPASNRVKRQVTCSFRQRPCSAFLSTNFSLHTSQWLEFRRLIADERQYGFVNTKMCCIKKPDDFNLSTDSQKMVDTPNAGGSSVMSEALSFEMLTKCFGAKLLLTEMEVQYFPMGGSITDYVCEVFGQSIGVSVTRAMKFGGDYEEEDAQALLNKKLKGIVQSTKNSLFKWKKQILHVWSENAQVSAMLHAVLARIAPERLSNTVVVITEATGNGRTLFANPKSSGPKRKKKRRTPGV